MSQARRMRRQQERELTKSISQDKITHTPLPDLANSQMINIKSEIERIRQEAYTQGCNDGYESGYDAGFSEGGVAGVKKGYTLGWNDAYKKLSLDTINRIASIAFKVVLDDWGKFAFKKKMERIKYFASSLAQRINEYLNENIDDEAKQAELQALMNAAGFDSYIGGGENSAGKS